MGLGSGLRIGVGALAASLALACGDSSERPAAASGSSPGSASPTAAAKPVKPSEPVEQPKLSPEELSVRVRIEGMSP